MITEKSPYIKRVCDQLRLSSQNPQKAILDCKQMVREQDLLIIISEITDSETENEVRNLYHSQYHVYDFDTYLSLLSELCNLLLSGVTKDEALKLIDKHVKQIYLKNSDNLYILDN